VQLGLLEQQLVTKYEVNQKESAILPLKTDKQEFSSTLEEKQGRT